MLHVLLVAVIGEVKRADARRLDVKGYVAVGEGHASTGSYPARADFRYLGEAVVPDAPAPRAPVAVAARCHRALRHLD